MAKTIVGSFDSFEEAQDVLRDLQQRGYSRDDISVIANNVTGKYSSESAGVSPSHLSRLFKSQTGTSITRFRNQQRVQRFMFLYRDGRHTTALAAALEAGFGSYAQFYRVFRAETGGRPSLSRTEHRPPAVDDRRAAHDQVMAEPEGGHWTPEG